MKIVLCCLFSLLAYSALSQTQTSPSMNPKPLVCKLTTPELQQRKKTVIAELKKLVLEKVETSQGAKFKFEGSDKTIDLLTSFIKTERLCCDFFIFALYVKDENAFTWLELSGPEGTKEFIETEIGL
jgi:hypothetical protein